VNQSETFRFLIMAGSVAVLGSLNMDVTFACDSFPKPGETLLCHSVLKGAGGKGLNQAVASAKAGTDTALFGAVGQDADGDFLIDLLNQSSVTTDGIARVSDTHSGLAHIIVDSLGENSIIVASGANMSALLNHTLFADARAHVFLAQLEMDPALVGNFLQMGKECGAIRILNAAPALPSAQGLFLDCDMIVVNEHELAFFCGWAGSEMTNSDIEVSGRSLLTREDQSVIVTLGALGALHVTLNHAQHYTAPKVHAVDTTGAGDCFCGVLAASIAQGMSVSCSIERAIQAAAIAVSRPGAAAAMPLSAEIDQ
jgi:ribokinase